MAESGRAPGRIFISYRREDTAYPAGWLFDRLTEHFKSGEVFKDVDSIELGDDFVEEISAAVGSCDVLLALIGEQWLTITDQSGERRLDDPGDFVRVEIEAALSRNVRVIPILVDGATMPGAEEVPPSLAGLSRRQALELSPSRFDFDSGRLLTVLDKTLADVRVEDKNTPRRGPDSESTHLATAASEPIARAGEAAPPDIAPVHREPDSSDARADAGAGRRRGLPRAGIVAALAGLALIIVAILVLGGEDEASQSPASQSPAIIFEDDFSDRSSGWKEDGSEPIAGDISDGHFRIHVEAGRGTDVAWISPEASDVFPTTSKNLGIQVDAQRTSGGSNQADIYGVFCRAGYGERDYRFELGAEQITISKWGVDEGFTELEAVTIPAEVDLNAANDLRAVCSTIEGGGAVLLELSVNGNMVAAATDRDDPYLAGTTGLFAFAGETLQVEFDNFIVEEI
jgi:hypothetical protein